MPRLVSECPREYIVLAAFTLTPIGCLAGLAFSPWLWTAIATANEPAALVGALGTWVGSVGTIAAAGIAIWVVRYQLRANRRAEFERDAARIEARAALVAVVQQKGNGAISAQSVAAPTDERNHVVAKLAWEALKAVSWDTANSSVEVEELLHLRMPTERAVQLIATAQIGQLSDKQTVEFREVLDVLERCRRRLLDEAVRLRGL